MAIRTQIISSISNKLFSHLFCRSPYYLVLFSLLQLSIWMDTAVGYQDMYGTGGMQQQQRHDPNGMVQPHTLCHEQWQWECEQEKECIAKYDLCDGVAQCSDASDESEKNCRNYRYLQDHHQPAAPIPAAPVPPATNKPSIVSTTTTSKAVSKPVDNPNSKLRMEYLLLVLAFFVVFAGIIHTILKKRKKRFSSSGIRGFRKGESLVEDEDDLLISQMYT
uniref:Uncharacterized protein n=1 Tax=Ditylenchus dipsaci TaxID=166011 RepID=A0A915EFS5_9BILA